MLFRITVLLCLLSFREVVICQKSGFRFANNYGSNMVLQRGPLLAVLWGFGEENKEVKLTIIKKNVEIFSTMTNVTKGFQQTSIWKIKLPPIGATGPYQITAKSIWKGIAVSAILENVLFGDVWFCSGQSNMGFTVGMSSTAQKEFGLADNYENIRLFTMANTYSDSPVADLSPENIAQPWTVASKDAIAGPAWKYFSALCWMFGRRLYDQYKVPIGLIASKYGGTPAEAWSSSDSLRKCGLESKLLSYHDELSYSALWNAMIFPHVNTTIKGVIWYQGERNNLINPNLYACVFPEMINDWRKKWFQGTEGATEEIFHFGFVQLSPIGDDLVKERPFYPKIRWEQTANYGYAPNSRQRNVFMAVAMDLPDDQSPYGSIHPRYKATIADRLVLGARSMVYGEKNVTFKGPILDNCEVIRYGGEFVVKIHYREVGKDGITVKNKSGFEALSKDSGEWIPVKIISVTDDKQSILLSLPVDYVSAIRYAWSHRPCDCKHCAIYSVENDLPSPQSICYLP